MEMRNKKIDIFRGILIILVVIGHIGQGIIHDIIFLFHMPLFFIISGFLLDREHLMKIGYVRSKVKKMLIPYVIYLLIDLFVVKKNIQLVQFYMVSGADVR